MTSEMTRQRLLFQGKKKSKNLSLIISSFNYQFFESKYFTINSQKEFKSFIAFLNQISGYNLRQLQVKQTSFEEYCMSLIEYLYPLEEGEYKTAKDYVTGLAIFRLFIEDTNPSCTKGISHWGVDDLKEVKDLVIHRQNMLLELDIVDLVCEIISQITDYSVFVECMKLSIGLTIGGNPKAQEKFIQAFQKGFEDDEESRFRSKKRLRIIKQSKKNGKDDSVLARINDRLESCITVVREVYEEMTEIVVKYSAMSDKKEASYKKTIEQYDTQAKSYLKTSTKIYRFLQLLCEGHNQQLQDYLREQFPADHTLSSKNINFVQNTAQVLGAFVKYINPAVIELGEQIFDFLIEVIQGPCKLNQTVLFEGKIIDYCKDLLNEFTTPKDFMIKGFDSDKSKRRVERMIKTSIKLLYALLEANTDKNMLNYLAFNIDFDQLIAMLVTEYKNMFSHTELTTKQLIELPLDNLNTYLKVSVFDEAVKEAFDIYFLIRTLDEHSQVYRTYIDDLQGIQLAAYLMFEHHSGVIQLVFDKDDQLYNIFFVVEPACRYLDQSYKNSILKSIKRDSPKEKVSDLLNKAPGVFFRIEHLSRLLNNKRFYSPTQDMYILLRRLQLFIAFIINFIIFMTFEKKLVRGQSIDDPTVDSSHPFIRFMGALYCLIGLMLFWVWFKVQAPMVIMSSFRKIYSEYKTKIKKSGYDGQMPDLDFKETALEDMSSSQRIELFEEVHIILGNEFKFPILEYYLRWMEFFFTDQEFQFILTFLSLSMAAVIMPQGFLYGLLLFDIIVSLLNILMLSQRVIF